jgi:hypothetical protein
VSEERELELVLELPAAEYSDVQIDLAIEVAATFGAARFFLFEPPDDAV